MLDMAGNSLITAAAVFAAEAHAAQVRKELNEPYIAHPLRVGKMAAQLGQSPEFIAAAYLHDVAEDTKITLLSMNNVFPRETMALVTVMTKWWQAGHPAEVIAANKAAYYAQILRTPRAPLLKVLDRVDNLYDFARMARMAAPKSHRWAAKYHARTVEDFAPLLAHLDVSSDTASREARKYYDIALAALEVTL